MCRHVGEFIVVSRLALSVRPTTAAGRAIEAKSTTTGMLRSPIGSAEVPAPTGSFVTALGCELPRRWPRGSRTVLRVTRTCVGSAAAQELVRWSVYQPITVDRYHASVGHPTSRTGLRSGPA